MDYAPAFGFVFNDYEFTARRFLQPKGFSLKGPGLELSANIRTGTAEPSAVGMFIKDQDLERTPREMVMDMAKDSPLFGHDRMSELGFWAYLKQNLEDLDVGPVSLTSKRHEKPTPSSNTRNGFMAATPTLIQGKHFFNNEGVWLPPGPFKASSDPAVLATKVQFNLRIRWVCSIHGFDMRRLGFGYVAGTAEPKSDSGMRGNGRIPMPVEEM